MNTAPPWVLCHLAPLSTQPGYKQATWRRDASLLCRLQPKESILRRSSARRRHHWSPVWMDCELTQLAFPLILWRSVITALRNPLSPSLALSLETLAVFPPLQHVLYLSPLNVTEVTVSRYKCSKSRRMAASALWWMVRAFLTRTRRTAPRRWVS